MTDESLLSLVAIGKVAEDHLAFRRRTLDGNLLTHANRIARDITGDVGDYTEFRDVLFRHLKAAAEEADALFEQKREQAEARAMVDRASVADGAVSVAAKDAAATKEESE